MGKVKVGPNAFIIGAISTSKDAESLGAALHCAKTIRKHGFRDDIVFFTVDMPASHREMIESLRYKVVQCDPLDYPGIPQNQDGWQDAQKIQYWSLAQYHKVVALDINVEFKNPKRPKKDLWKHEELSCSAGVIGVPINTSAMFIQPERNTYYEMIDMIQGGFDLERGWGGYGPFSFANRYYHDWNFQFAGGAQGFLLYYFYILNKSLHTKSSFNHWFKHHTGDNKQPYLSKVKSALREKIQLM